MRHMDQTSMRRAIEHKRDGGELTPAQWESIIAGYMDGTVDDAQMASLAMAGVSRGLTTQETVAMTRAMVASGITLQFPAGTIVVDKHSSGGVSDIVSLVAVPVVAASGVRVAKLSGRALGHTGGTIDKLETIAGFNASLSMQQFVEQVHRVGAAIAAQTRDLVPADKRLYHLRDRTGTVPSVGLIASSIVSKKIAGGAHAFVFDVKVGSAAFMREPHHAMELAHALVTISREFGRRAHAVVTDMNEPLGRAIGTGIEVIEAREFLRGGERDSRAHEGSLRIAAAMLDLAGVGSPEAAALRALESGAAYEKFVEMIEAQGASRQALESMRVPEQLETIVAEREGFVASIDGVALGNAAREWTAGTPTGGIRVRVRTGDRVQRGTVLAELYGHGPHLDHVRAAFVLTDTPPPPRPLIYGTV
jgi:pyrimidine-nucleoside phosphorylase